MFVSNDEFYAYVRGLVRVLADAGDARWSRQLADDLACSSLSGEVLGRCMNTLKGLRKAGVARQLGLDAEIRKVIGSLEKVLRRT